jgi:polyisoprenoid-binding protein YceI
MLTPRLALVFAVMGLLFWSTNLGDDPGAGRTAYRVDTSVSRVYVKVGSATFLGHPHGVEGRLKDGKLTFGGAGALVFDMASFTADTAEARRRVGLRPQGISASDAKKITETMRDESVLDARRYPTAEFRVTAVTPLDRQAAAAPGRYQLAGEFTLHGVRKNIQFNAKLVPDRNQQTRLTGSFTLKQSDYHITPYSTFGGAVAVTDQLEITGDLVLAPDGDK